MTVKVSVVIPAYNAAAFIRETLDSVFVQAFRDYEVIVVNDGSPDTEELERVLAPIRGRIVYLKQKNLGASAARNAGLRVARGEIAAFLDADDLWMPDYLERQLEFMAGGGYDLVCADGEIFGQSADAGRTCMEVLMADAPPAGEISFLDLLRARRSLITSGVMVRRGLVLDVGLFDETLRNAQDFDLWLRLALHKGRLAYHRVTLLRCRTRPESLTGDLINTHRRDLRVFDKVERSYDFTATERQEALAVIGARRAELEYELGKLYLLRGDYADAMAAFSHSDQFGGGWKPRLALGLTRAAPRLLRALYARRVK